MWRDGDGQVFVRATRISSAPRIDGIIDDPQYRETPSFSGFIQADPDEGAPSTERTEAWVLFDADNIYIAIRCWDTRAGSIVANEMRRDNARLNQNDNIAVSLDTFFDGRNGFQFNLGAAGGMRDGAVADEAKQADWNGVYEARAARDANGWGAELAIPFKTLRYPRGVEQKWHMQVRRVIRSGGRNELTYLTPMKANWGLFGTNKFSLAATLVGIETPPPGLNLEVKPYFISPLTTDLAAAPPVRNDFAPTGGVDVKYGITKGITADFTFNTDFAQVEADEAQINLTRFNLSYPEKREFFLEGQSVFDFGGGTGPNAVPSANAPTIFYSRRIGLSGSRQVPVFAGGRLTGRSGPWLIGAFNMQTEEDRGIGVPSTNFSVMRIRRNVLRRSAVGGLYTRRSAFSGGTGANDVWGLDANFALYENVYFGGYVSQSKTAARRGSDFAYRGQFNYNADRYGFMLDRQVVEENFIPEIGFLRRPDFRRSFVEGRFSPRPRNHPVIRKTTYRLGLDYITDNQNVLESREAQATFRLDFHSGDALTVEHSELYELLRDPFVIAPGVRIDAAGYSFQNTVVSYTAGGQRRFSGTGTVDIGSFYDGSRKTTEYRGRVDFTPQLGVEPMLSFNWIELPQASFTTTIVGARGVYTLSPKMFASALVQRSSSSSALSANLRFRWEYRPGSELFVVYSDGRQELPSGNMALVSRGVVVKINRLFRY
jgi:hypothetical protein